VRKTSADIDFSERDGNCAEHFRVRNGNVPPGSREGRTGTTSSIRKQFLASNRPAPRWSMFAGQMMRSMLNKKYGKDEPDIFLDQAAIAMAGRRRIFYGVA
jgi:hypothetical protein